MIYAYTLYYYMHIISGLPHTYEALVVEKSDEFAECQPFAFSVFSVVSWCCTSYTKYEFKY